MISKIVLGTVQFGVDYGINNKRGKIPKEEVFTILNNAFQSGIDTFDTAYSYGESEKVIGEFLRTYSKNLKIISKLPDCNKKEVKSIFNTSLKLFGLSKLYGYLIHSFKNYMENPLIWKELETLKQNGYIEKIGFSIYYPSELEFLFKNNLRIDIIQVPFNVFDHRFEHYFEEIKKRGIELYVRSIFLQGLVFKKANEINEFFSPLKEKLQHLSLLSEKNNVSVLSLCMGFVLENNFIDKVVIGIDGLTHLNEIIQTLNNYMVSADILLQLKQLKFEEEKILLPFNWPNIMR